VGVAKEREVAQGKTLFSIGQVLAKLSAQFPDLTPSKLRFFEDQDLISPHRTDSGYRKYSAEDIDRVRLILVLQRDHYLPHKVIRQYLADLDAGKPGVLPAARAQLSASSVTSFKRADLLELAKATETQLTEAISAGLIPSGALFDDSSLDTLRRVVELAQVGIEPRHLRTLKTSVQREADLISGALGGVKKTAAGRAKAEEQATDIAVQLNAIRTTLLRKALDELT